MLLCGWTSSLGSWSLDFSTANQLACSDSYPLLKSSHPQKCWMLWRLTYYWGTAPDSRFANVPLSYLLGYKASLTDLYVQIIISYARHSEPDHWQMFHVSWLSFLTLIENGQPPGWHPPSDWGGTVTGTERRRLSQHQTLKLNAAKMRRRLHLFPLFATQKIGIIPKPGRMRPSLVHNNQHHKVGDIGEDMNCDAVFQGASKNIFLCCSSTCDKGQMFLFPCFVLVFLLPNVQPCSPLLCTLQSPATLPGPQGQPIRVQVGVGSANCGAGIARVSWVSSVLVDNQR